jgi:alpha-tubulin suppressor-like RCC1 family protein
VIERSSRSFESGARDSRFEAGFEPGTVNLPAPAKAVAAGKHHALAVLTDGSVYGWGDGEDGQVDPTKRVDVPKPVPIPEMPPSPVSVVAGDAFSVLVDAAGNLYTWGSNTYGQLGCAGNGSVNKVSLGEPVVSVAAGAGHVVVALSSGAVLTWGYGADGQLGHADKPVFQEMPRQVDALRGIKAVSVGAGDGHTVVLAEDGTAYLFGRGRDGQLGSNSSFIATPMQLGFFGRPENPKVVGASLGNTHTLLLTNP